MEGYGNSGGATGSGGEVDEEGGVVEGPREEKDLGGGSFTFSGSNNGGYGFEVVLMEGVIRYNSWRRLNGLIRKNGTHRDNSYNTIPPIFCSLKHTNCLVILD